MTNINNGESESYALQVFIGEYIRYIVGGKTDFLQRFKSTYLTIWRYSKCT